MTKSTITRERLEEIRDCCWMDDLGLSMYELSELARIALDAIDSDPVAYSLIFRNMDGVLNNYINTNTTFSTREKAEAYGKGGSYEMRSDGRLEWVPNTALDPVVVPLYRHAQPAPVVPDQMLCDFYEVNNWPDLVRELVKHVEQLQDSAKRNVKPWEDTFPETLLPAYIERVKQTDEACRAAMLQAGDTVSGNSFSDMDLEGMSHGNNPQANAYRELLAYRRNSPAIPDGYVMVPKEPTQAMCAAFNDSDYGRKSLRERYVAMLSAAPQEVNSES